MLSTAAPLFAWLDVVAAPTAAGVTTVIVVVAYRLIIDRSAVKSELKNLTGQVKTLSDKVNHLEVLYDEQRGLKHQAFNDVARALTALELVRRLARDFTCEVLAPL